MNKNAPVQRDYISILDIVGTRIFFYNLRGVGLFFCVCETRNHCARNVRFERVCIVCLQLFVCWRRKPISQINVKRMTKRLFRTCCSERTLGTKGHVEVEGVGENVETSFALRIGLQIYNIRNAVQYLHGYVLGGASFRGFVFYAFLISLPNGPGIRHFFRKTLPRTIMYT